MIEADGYKWFGYFVGMDYNEHTESFEQYLKYKNRLAKEKIIEHILHLDPAYTSGETFDVITNEEINIHPGMYIDGVFLFPTDFLYYYQKYDIGIPPEYEQYLIDEIGLKP